MRFVVAGNFQQALDYAESQGWLPRKEWVWVPNIGLVAGLRGITVICIGEYWKHPHWRHIEEEHDFGNFNLEFPGDA